MRRTRLGCHTEKKIKTRGGKHRCRVNQDYLRIYPTINTFWLGTQAYLLLQTLGTTQTRSFPPPSSARAPPTAPPPPPSLLRTALRSFIACALLPFSLFDRVRPENTKRVETSFFSTVQYAYLVVVVGVDDVYEGNTCAYLSSPSTINFVVESSLPQVIDRSRAMVLYACVSFSNFHEAVTLFWVGGVQMQQVVTSPVEDR